MSSTIECVTYTDAAPRLRVLDDAALARIHAAALDVLATTGVRVPLAPARALFAEAGAHVDEATGHVRLPATLVEEALKQATTRYTLCAHASRPDQDLVIDGTRGYLSTDGSPAAIVDWDTRQPRPSTLADLKRIVALADALPAIGFLWQSVSAADVPPAERPLRELLACLMGSTKHVQAMTIVTGHEARAAVRMARAIAGGSDALRQRPILSAFQCAISPLSHDAEALAAALVLAEAGVPTGYLSMPLSGATAPITVAGHLVQAHAEVLSGLALIQLAHPGAPVFYAACGTVMDPRTGALTGGGPEDALLAAATCELGHWCGLPVLVGVFAPGATAPDWRSGLEGGLNTAFSVLARAELMSGAGCLRTAQVFDPVQMVLDAEAFRLLAHLGRGIATDAAALAADAIRRAGPGGNYLMADHTLRHMRGVWQPRTYQRGGEAGDPMTEAQEFIRDRLAHAEPLALDPGLRAELEAIIAAAASGRL
ncbi:MAG: trimethylamine methyltransferase family protein [Chloroflexi bacterium]|nr:trimethylamine methyltransferase family protein [Chloroflexota bacterium]MBU1747481.1 trimethylamine methyltransferase family protein [Chloroflexota bacterium]MBU1878321.1 trimethylamine methyltransferase family protein [Chloroflexota bacterium]